MASAAPDPRDDLHRLVDELPENAVEGAVLLLNSIVSGRIASDQAWFWTPEWQAGEREADAQLAAGEGQVFDTDEGFIAHLRSAPRTDRL
jgi:hypothetical protein